MKKWVALFSQTGSEVVDLALHFDRWPDIIITNNKGGNIHPLDIYNGHPGLITEYPELKGKDPQQRFFDEKYKYNYYGSVVHKVVPEVDSGEIVSECKRFNTITSLDQAFNNLRSTSLTAWIDFLQTDSIITV